MSVWYLQWTPYKEVGGFCLKIYGILGYLTVYGLDRVEVNIGGEVATTRFYGEGDHIDKFAERHLSGAISQLRDFAAYVRREKEPEVSIRDVLQMHRWLEEAYRLAALQ